MGMGREKLLREIEKQGSIAAAARQIGLSYKKAWKYIKSIEERLGKKLVETQKGGKKGGGSKLTQDAKELLEQFDNVIKEFEKIKEKLEK